MTIVVLVIGMKKIYWYPEAGPLIHGDYRLDAETISNVLQLVAKIHELLIVASLSSIALAMFRYRLIKDGVRLGFLTGSYRVGDVGYLGTAAFWRQGLDIQGPWEILLSGFLVFATIMSTVDTDDLKNAGCNTIQGIYTTRCPAGGFNEISTWVQNHGATQLRNNLTFSATSADIRRHVVFTQANFSEDGAKTTLSTTAPQFILDSVGLFQRYINDRNRTVGAVSRESRLRLNFTSLENPRVSSMEELYQPFVQSRCEVHDWDQMRNSAENITYPNPVKHFQCFNQTECLNRSEDLPVFNIDRQDIVKNDAYSAVSNYWTSRNNSSVIFLAGWSSEVNATALTHIVDGFAQQKRQNGKIRGSTTIGDFGNKTTVEGLLAKVFGGYLTDALAQQYGDRGGIHKYTPHSHNITLDEWGNSTTKISGPFHKVVKELKTGLAIDIQAERYGYGTGQQRKTASFAQAMLFIYLGAIAIYSAIIAIYSKRKTAGFGQNVIPWADLQDLFVLGLRTPPGGGDDLSNSGVRVSDIKIWQKVIAVRAGDDKKVQLVFQGTSLKELEPSKAGEYR
ncbi:hypothetical protein QIS74_08106 [Colletotrichum tabaci]|uniref:Uncharacterized protein n=1 Tax=Colletotrichum tabaci TaxID=1209068 RepID=A0AAV9T814_9PEZI